MLKLFEEEIKFNEIHKQPLLGSNNNFWTLKRSSLYQDSSTVKSGLTSITAYPHVNELLCKSRHWEKVIGTQAPCMFARGKSPLINKNPPHMHLNTIWDSFKGHKRKMLLESCLKTLHSLLFLPGSHVVSNLAPKTFKFQQTQPIQTSLPSFRCCPWSNRQIWNWRMRGNQWPLIRALSLHCNKTPHS